MIPSDRSRPKPLSKEVTVLVAGFMSLGSLVLVLLPLFGTAPLRPSYVVAVAMFLGSSWWLRSTLSSTSLEDELDSELESKLHSESEPNSEFEALDKRSVSPAKTAIIFLGVLGIVPWAMIWINFLAPKFGLQHLPVQRQLLFVLGIPAVIAWIAYRLRSLSEVMK
jgi:hypothetical protein